MRKQAKSWLMKIILSLIIIVFALYFGSTHRDRSTETIASLDGQAISYADFHREYQDLLALAQRQYQDTLTDEVIKSLNLKQLAFDTLIQKAIFLYKTNKLGIRVTDEEVRNTIISFPAFQRDGVFDDYLYRDILKRQNLSPEEFEAAQKTNIITGKLRELLISSVFITDEDALEFYKLMNERVNIQFVRIKASDMAKEISPSTGDLEEFLTQNASRFRIPEQVRLKYLIFPATEANTVSEEDITHQIAVQKETWRKSNPHLTEKEMRNLAIAELKRISGMQNAARKAKNAHDTIYQEENFDQFANQNRYTVHTTNSFSLTAPPQEFRNIRDFQKEISLLQKDEISSVLSDDSKYYLFQRIEEKPAYTPPLKEIEASVRSAFMASESQGMMVNKAQDILDQLRKGADWRKICSEKRLNITETGFFRIGNIIPQIGSSEEISDAILGMTSTIPYPTKPFIIGDSAYIIRFVSRETPNLGDYETKRVDLKQNLLSFRQEILLRTWLKETQENMMKKGLLKINEGVETL